MCLLEHLRRLNNPAKHQEVAARLMFPDMAIIDGMLADLPEPEGNGIGESCAAALEAAAGPDVVSDSAPAPKDPEAGTSERVAVATPEPEAAEPPKDSEGSRSVASDDR
eukprot:977746-Alexandrium_andersonii.AAC.1